MPIPQLITSAPAILGGQPVFAGTRVPVESLLAHQEAGVSLTDFRAGFRTVSRAPAVARLDLANTTLTAKNGAELYAAAA